MSKSTFLVVNLSRPKTFIEDYKKLLCIASLFILKSTFSGTTVQGKELINSAESNAGTYDNDIGLILFILGETARQINAIGFTAWINYISQHIRIKRN
jgi:hypothetical protein